MALEDAETYVRANSAEALGVFGTNAQSAVPRLWELKDATNQLERYCVQKALKQIDPEAAAKASIQ
jgi:hypothetical protein